MDADLTVVMLDTALMGSVYDRNRDIDGTLDVARSLCSPWLDPSDSVLVARVERQLQAGRVKLVSPDDGLTLTKRGRSAFEDELCRPIPGRACHQHRLLHEQLRLAFLDHLPAERRRQVAAQLVAERRQCLACLGRRLDLLGDGPERRLVSERHRLMEDETLALGRRLASRGLDQDVLA